MPDENDALLDALADSVIDWGFEPPAEPEQPSGDDPKPDAATEEGGEPASPEVSNENPTPQEKSYTESELRQMVQAAQQAQNQQKVSEEFQRLLSSEDPDDKSKLQQFLKAQMEQTQTQRNQQAQLTQYIQSYAEGVLNEMGVDDAFIAKLSDEQKAKIDPDKFQSDGAWFKAVAGVQAELMAAEIIESQKAEQEKARQEALTNNAKGAQLRQPSLAAVGATTPSPGPQSNDELWQAFLSDIGLGEDE